MMNAEILKFIKSCVNNRRIRWTYHVNMRLKDRFIPRETILLSVATYEIIEQYPTDKYLPSYLIYAENKGRIIHIQIAVDIENKSVVVVTAYEPTPDKWEKGFKTRRKK